MTWIKKGLLFEPRQQFNWIRTHAQLPIVKRIGDDLYRIYFSGRDEKNRSQVGYIEIDINFPKKILYITQEPILRLGELGAFDDNGVSPLWITDYKELSYLYFLGWNQ